MKYLIYTQVSGNRPGVYISRPDGRLDQYTGNGHKSLEEAAKMLREAGVPYEIIRDAIVSGNGKE